MSVSLTSELWAELKRYLSPIDRAEAADTVVNILIDNDVEIEEIKMHFKGDTDIKHAIAQFVDDTEEELDEEEHIDDDY